MRIWRGPERDHLAVLGARPALEQRLLAVALADRVGAALATSHPVRQE
jgi:hypothetical protein